MNHVYPVHSRCERDFHGVDLVHLSRASFPLVILVILCLVRKCRGTGQLCSVGVNSLLRLVLCILVRKVPSSRHSSCTSPSTRKPFSDFHPGGRWLLGIMSTSFYIHGELGLVIVCEWSLGIRCWSDLLSSFRTIRLRAKSPAAPASLFAQRRSPSSQGGSRVLGLLEPAGGTQSVRAPLGALQQVRAPSDSLEWQGFQEVLPPEFPCWP